MFKLLTMRKLFAGLVLPFGFLAAATLFTPDPLLSASAQNPTCPTRPAGDSSNACASTAFVQANGGSTTQAQYCTPANQAGFVADGATNNDAAYTAWFNTVIANNGGCLQFGIGTYNGNSLETLTLTNCATGSSNNKKTYARVRIRGAGRDLTTLNFPGTTGGLAFNFCSFQHTVDIDDSLSIATGQQGLTNCISVTNTFAFFGEFNAKNRISATCRGNDGYGATNYWAQGITLSNVSNIDFYGYHYVGSPAAGSVSLSNGIGIALVAPTSPGTGTCTQPGCGTIYNISGAKIDYAGIGVQIGTEVQAVNIGAGTAILNGFRGVYVPASQTQNRQVNIIGAQISVNENQIYFATGVASFIISNNYLGVANTFNGIVLATDSGTPSTGGNQIRGNTFLPLSGSPSDCIFTATITAPLIIDANNFNGCNTGVETTSGSGGVIVGANNTYVNVNNKVIDASTTGPGSTSGNTIASQIPFTAQGDLLYGNGVTQTPMTRLAKTASAHQFLSNQGTSNNPAWAQPGTGDISTAINALLLGNGSVIAAYGGTTCTNQVATALSALGAATCSSVTNAMLASGATKHMIPISVGGQTQAQNTTAFILTLSQAAEAQGAALCPFSGTFRNLYVQTAVAPAVGQTFTFTWRVNATNTSLTCQISNPSTTCNDTTHTATCTAGQPYVLQSVTSATSGTLTGAEAGVELDQP